MKLIFKIFIFLINFSLFAQHITENAEYFELNLSNNNQSKTYQARDYVRYLPGYSYKPPQDGSDYMIGRIDESLIYPTDYQGGGEIVDIDDRPLNTSLAVGTTAGQADVTATGGAVYNIPIYIPKGTNGMLPKVSIVYNSQSGNCIAGLGWSISGLSAVTRTGKNMYFDDIIEGVQLNNTDNFSLDGRRLIKISENGSEIIYAGEAEDFSRVKYNINDNTFLLKTKNGNIIEYGFTQDAILTPEDINIPYAWYINKIIDRNGNYAEYKYLNEEGEIVIKEINYTGNEDAGLFPYNSIKFYYTEREDKNEVFFAGKKLKTTKLLRMIKVFSNNELVRTYKFKHNFDLYSKLNEIEEIGLNGEKINSIVVQYGEEGIISSNNLSNFNTTFPFQYFSGDFNGDGKTDIVAAKYSNYYGLKKLTTFNQIQDDLATTGDFSNYCYIDNSKNQFIGNAAAAYFADYNADNFEDILLLDVEKSFDICCCYYEYDDIEYCEIGYNGNCSYTDNNKTKYIKINKIKFFYGSDMGFYIVERNISNVFKYFTPKKKFIFNGDFDGDGSTDVILALNKLFNQADDVNNTNYYKITFTSLKKNSSSTISNINPFNLINAKQYYIIDFNGNGKQDILLVYDTKIKIFELNNNNELILLHTSNLLNIENEFLFGDFNGDGKTDIFTYNKNTTNPNTKIWISTGNSLIKKNVSVSYTQNNYKFIVGDFNGDKKSDILAYSGISGLLYVNYSNGIGFNEKIYDYGSYFPDKFYTIDYNGDGIQELLYISNNSNNRKIVYLNNVCGGSSCMFNNPNEGYARSLFVTKIKGGFNNWVAFAYRPMSYVYEKESIDASEYTPSEYTSNFKSAMMLVSELWRYNGTINELGDGHSYAKYKYYCAIYNKLGKGFLGFKDIVKTSFWSSDYEKTIINKSDYNKDYEFLIPSMTLISDENFNETYNFATSQIKKYFDDDGFELYPLLNKRYLFKPIKYVEENTLTNTKTITNTTIDNNGNITQKEILYQKLNGQEDKKETYNYTYTNAGLDYPYLPTQITKASTLTSQPEFTETTSFTYNNQNGNLLTQESLGITTHYENYDNFGNPWKIRTSVSDPLISDRYETFTFENTGRYVTSRTNQLDQTITYEYNPIWGKVSKTTDITGLETRYEYDNWGRLKKAFSPTGLVTTNSINWVTSEDPEIPTALYYTLTETIDMPYKKTYYDSFGRTLRTGTKTFGNKIYADKRYDKFGHTIETTDAYFEGNYTTANCTNYEFDSFSRLKKSTYHENKFNTNTITTFDFYDPNETTQNKYFEKITSQGKTFTNYFDAAGNMVKTTGTFGTIENTFASNGQPTNILAQNVATGMQYDPITAQQTSLTDANSGTTIYDYNAFGKLKYQKDGNNNEQTVNIDEYGRTTSILVNGTDETNIEYVENGNGLGQVKSTQAPNGYKTQNTYDEFGRVTQTTETIDGQNYTHNFEYDQYGKLVKETYPSGFELTYIYNSQGELMSVKKTDNNQAIWYCDDYNEKGQPNKIYLGANGSSLKTEYTYNGFGRITNIKTGNNFDMSYEWDNIKGNLTSRSDGSNNEVFSYDLDRLTAWTVNGQTFNTCYNNKGNIISKTDVGTYTYDPTKKHAVAQITNPTNAISIAQQDITYTNFNKAKTIAEGNYQLQIEYGPSNFRKKTTLQENGTSTNTRIFAGNYEKETLEDGTVKEYHYISGPTGLIAIYIITNGTGHLYYTATDHLGSICQILEPNGTVVEETNYGPWGRIRNSDDWTYNNAQALTLIFRGFTGHEMLPHFALINMNGRMYDPVLGRMLSPDNYVQDPSNAQNYNRYAYVLNNPLKYTDPSGEFIFAIAAFIVVGGYDLLTNNWQGWEGSGKKAVMAGVMTAIFGPTVADAGKYLGRELLKYSATTLISNNSPSLNIPISDNLSFSISPAVIYGSSQIGVGINGSLNFNYDNFHISVGGSLTRYGLNFGNAKKEARYYWTVGYDDGTSGIWYSSSYYKSGHTSQNIGAVGYHYKDFSITYQNDYMFGLPADGGDRYRTAALQLSYKDYSVGVNLFTGDPGLDEKSRKTEIIGGHKTYVSNGNDNPDEFRAGILYFGYKNYRTGWNSEQIRNIAQNKIAHDGITWLTTFGRKPSPYFRVLNISPSRFYSVGTHNPYTLW